MSVKEQLKKILTDEAIKLKSESRQQFVLEATKMYQGMAMDLNSAYLEFLNEFSTNTTDEE